MTPLRAGRFGLKMEVRPPVDVVSHWSLQAVS
jgi:hypothetical protein